MENTKKRKAKDPAFAVLVCENIFVHKDVYSYVVSEKTSKGAKDNINARGNRPTYHPNLPSAILEVSKRLLNRKLANRAEAGKYDFESLAQLIHEHNEEIAERFGLKELSEQK